MTSPDHPSPQASAPPSRSSWPILLLLAIGLVGLPLLAAHVPARIKLLGIFPAVIALLAGEMLLTAQRRTRLSKRWTRGMALLVVPLVLALFAVESYRSWRGEFREMFAAHLRSQPGGASILKDLQNVSQSDSRSTNTPQGTDAAQNALLASYRPYMDPPVDWYLDDRLSGLPGDMSARMQIVVTASELTIALVCGWAFVFWRTRPHPVADP